MRSAPEVLRSRGLTLVEILIVLAIVPLLTGISIPTYRGYRERALVTDAVADMRIIEAQVDAYRVEYGKYPNSLTGVAEPPPKDPWGNEYEYLDVNSGAPGVAGKRRKDKNLVPINTDFDLYSKGPDGAYIGVAESY